MSGLVLHQAASDFAIEMQDMLNEVLPGDHHVAVYQLGKVYVVRPETGDDLRVDRDDEHKGCVPLQVAGQTVGRLRISCRCVADSADTYLAVHASQFAVLPVDYQEPLLRLEYLRDAHTDPASHWQIHGDAGALTMLRRGLPGRKASQLSTLHLPVGGHRMRPCLEDVLEMLVRNFGVDTVDGWEAALRAGRQRWRRHQTGAITRDAAEEAARVLQELGYAVTPPTTGHAPTNTSRLEAW